MSRHGTLCIPFLIAALGLLSSSAEAKDWFGGTGAWNIPGNWVPSGVPDDGDNVHIDAGTAIIGVGTNAYANEVYVASDSGDTATLEINTSTGNLYLDYDLQVGYGGTGTVTHYYGTVSHYYGTGDITLGYQSTGVGTYNLYRGVIQGKKVVVGRDGTGYFNNSMSGRLNLYDGGDLIIGDAGSGHAGTGTYRLASSGEIYLANSDCDIYVGAESSSYIGTGRFEWFREGGIFYSGSSMIIGQGGTLAMGYDFSGLPAMVSGMQNGTMEVTNGATVTKSDGIISAMNYLRIGSATGAGYANMTSGTVQVGQAVYVGDGGDGTATQDGGTFNITTHLHLGINGSGSNGTYRLRGGNLNVGSNIFGGTGTGTLIIDGGTLSVSGTTISVDNLILGDESGRTGSYTASGKTLAIGTQTVGNAGTGNFWQSGGTNTVTTLRLGYGATGNGTYYLLNSGTLNTGTVENGPGTGKLQIDGGTFVPSGTVNLDTLAVGISNTGAHTQSGQTYNIGTLSLGSATYTLSGGTLNVAGSVVNSTWAGTLSIRGGTFAPTGNVDVDLLKIGDGAAGAHTQSGQTYTVAELTIANGTYTLAGGALNVSGQTVNGTGTGTLNVRGGTFTPGGSVALDSLKIGDGAAGAHTQSSQAYTVGELTIGDGTYTLAGGTLNVSGQTVNGTGTGMLNIRGGTFAPGGSVAMDSLRIGDGAAGAHTQSSQAYTVGELAIGSGTYTLSGGMLSVSGQVVNGTGTGSLVLNGGSFAPTGAVGADSLIIAQGTTASYTHSAATTWTADSMSIGSAGGNGTFRLSNSGQLAVSGNIALGSGGTGRLEWFRSSGLTASKIVMGSQATLAMGAGFSMSDVITLTEGLNTNTLEVTNGALGTHLSGTAAIKTLQLGSATGAGTYRLAGDGILNIGSSGSIRVGADNAAGRFEWYTDGAPSSPSIVMGSAGTLAMGRAFDMEDLLDGSLFGGTLSGLGSATLEMTNFGAAVQNSGAAQIRSLLVGGQHGQGDYAIEGGSLQTQILNIGSAAAGVFSMTAAATVEVSQMLTFGAQAHFEAAAGSAITLTGSNVFNYSTNPDDLAGMANLTLTFDPRLIGMADMMELAGTDLGATMDGFVSNFALDTLIVGVDALRPVQVNLFDMFRNSGPDPEALYVHNLYVGKESTLNLNFLNVYYDGALSVDGEIINGSVTFINIPEPATLSLLALGGLAMLRRRKRP